MTTVTDRPPVGESIDAERKHARKQLEKRRDFQAHIVAYVVVNAFLVGVWAVTGRGYFWPGWFLGGWGIGVVLNAWDVFIRKPVSEEDVDRFLAKPR